MKNDIIYLLNEEFKTDKRTNKINGSIGIYLDDDNKPYVIPVVSKVASAINFTNFNYLPIDGDSEFLDESTKLIIGDINYKKHNSKLVKQSVCGGTNGLYIWANSISLQNPKPSIIISNPTWENHLNIFQSFGFNIIQYQHLDKNNNFNFDLLVSTIKNNPNSFVLFQSGLTHNPTGTNPTNDQWQQLAKIIEKYDCEVIFDTPYAGLGINIQDDCYCIRYFLNQNIKTTINFSYSKNMTIYQHRTGILISNVNSNSQYNHLKTNYKQLFRINNSSPPGFGQNIVKIILSNTILKSQWQQSLGEIFTNVYQRRILFDKLTNNIFPNISKQSGFFSILSLSQRQIIQLKEKHAVYILPNGRINFASIPLNQIELLAKIINTL